MLSESKIAFLGLGLMGGPMAKRLANRAPNLTVWNRDTSKSAPFAEAGVTVADNVVAALTDAEVVITMVTDGQAALSIISQLPEGFRAPPQAIYIDMSSASMADGQAIQARMAAHGFRCLDAPVSGGTVGAVSGTLAIMVGGADETLDAAAPVLSTMGSAVHVGPAGSGYLTKLINQSIVASTIASVSEAMFLLELQGANLPAAKKALEGGFADSRVLREHGDRIIAGNFTPGGPAHLHLKDLRNLSDHLDGSGLQTPMLDQVHSRFRRLCNDLGYGNLDHSALHLELLESNGKHRPD